MTNPHQDDVLELSVDIDAKPETVFPYFTDARRYVQWMGQEAILDASPGGQYLVRMREGVETSGSFVEVDPPNRLVFTWGWAGDAEVPPGSSRVEVLFTPHGDGTRVVLRHHDLPTPAQREHHGAGWRMYLDRLSHAAVGADPGVDPNA